MKYMEVSQKINVSKGVNSDELKDVFLVRLRRAFQIERLTETDDGLHIEGTTGGNDNLVCHARIVMDVGFVQDGDSLRILIHGNSRPARSLLVLYSFMFFSLLVLGLAPGSIETSYEKSGALDALVFLLFGVLVFYDIDKKSMEPREYLEDILSSLNTQFG